MMLPKKELMALAGALKATPEYGDMIRQRRLIMQNPRMGRMVLMFEREHARIMRHDFPEEQAAPQLRSLYNDNKGFLEAAEIKAYMKAAQEYQRMVTQCVDYLNGLLDFSHAQPY